MEPADIDWKRVEWRFVRDEAFENINAPKWVDLACPDASPVDDEAWFCRPDCRHPKTFEDFPRKTISPKGKLMRSSSEKLPLGERNANFRDANGFKRRGAVLASSPLREGLKPKAASKKFREDAENRDPNMPTPPPATRPIGVPKGGKNLKELIKSSAEKKANEEEREELVSQKKPLPRLRSTLSARNLFSGRDILGQISEFCSELKKMAVGGKTDSKEEEEEEKKTKMAQSLKSGNGLDKKSSRMVVKVDKEKSPAALKEVRASPPTPQRFPSPSASAAAHRLKHAKGTATTTTTSPSPLRKPPKSLATQVEQSKERKILAAKDDESTSSSSSAAAAESEGSAMDMLWFLKPCTYLVK
ncbi:uncharacterized protein [Typha angustifolia]|uniref:uncharacterized protein n=1 Tax=Typha angustifolia TaxID=59011 RepID=UPI003C2F1EFC